MFDRKSRNESITSAVCAVGGLVLSWIVLRSEKAGALEGTTFVLGLLAGFIAIYAHTLREALMTRASPSDQLKSFRLLRLFTVIPVIAPLPAMIAVRLLSFPNETAIGVGYPYGLGLAVMVCFIASFEALVEMLRDES